MRDFHLPGRSPVHARNGMAATSHPLSTLAALDVLKAGGNAMDAAMCACAVQCVVEPQSTGIGGDCFALIAPGGTDKIVAYNGSGRAPAAATPEWYASQGITEIDSATPHAASVPGTIEAWARLAADHGTWDLGRILEPAIRYAEDGYPVHSRVSFDWWVARGTLANDQTSADLFMPGGKVPAPGTTHRQPLLAATLRKIAKDGPDAFYKGPVAEDIVGHLRSRGGLHTMEDFAAAKGEYVTPIRTNFRGYDVYECPPNGQGIVALMILNMVTAGAAKDWAPMSVERLHFMIEATKLAYRDRNAFVADPTQAKVPVEGLLSAAHAKKLLAEIDPKRATDPMAPATMPKHEDTVYISVVDKDRTAVSFINSLFRSFGTGLMAPRSGVLIHNRASSFVLKKGHPNCIAPGKRPMHTIIPGMATKDGRAAMPFGVMGGHYQSMGHAWFLSNLLDFGLDIQEAIDLPRLFPTLAGPLEIEGGFPAETVERLKAMGHKPVRPERPIGGGQAVMIDWKTGVLTGGSEPRKDGLALGF